GADLSALQLPSLRDAGSHLHAM
ncbi:MAG: hypothetical protein JWO52_6815, partial [Gammaproteobacteria bacterium]|nr:hypothetical protein [Gammaproteobacteria bacterium]